jgi:hypothetical protein
LIECVHVEWQVEELAFVVCYWAICISVEFYNRIDEIPYLFIACVKYMGSILMDVDAFNIFTVNIPAKMCSFVDDKTFFPGLFGTVCERGSEKT